MPSRKPPKRSLTRNLGLTTRLTDAIAKPPQPAKPRQKPPAKATKNPTSPPANELASPKERAEHILAQIFELDRGMKSDFFAMGRLLRDLHDPELYQALGYKSFSQLLRERDVPQRTMAYRLIEIVDSLDAATAKRLGVERASLAIAYAKLTRPAAEPKAVIHRDPPIEMRDAKYKLSNIPTDKLAIIVQSLRAGVPVEPPRALHKTARSLAQRLHHLELENVRVASTRRGATDYITIRLSLADAQKLAELLR